MMLKIFIIIFCECYIIFDCMFMLRRYSAKESFTFFKILIFNLLAPYSTEVTSQPPCLRELQLLFIIQLEARRFRRLVQYCNGCIISKTVNPLISLLDPIRMQYQELQSYGQKDSVVLLLFSFLSLQMSPFNILHTNK